MEEIIGAVRECTKMLEESFEVLTNLQEDPEHIALRNRGMRVTIVV